MFRFAIRRVILIIPILFGVSVLVFFWVRELPGGPAQALLGEQATPEAIAQIRHQYHLDQPVYDQYAGYLDTLLHGDFGESITTHQGVVAEFREKFPATIELGIAAMLFAISFGVPLGVLSAKKHGSKTDHIGLIGSLMGISIPTFVLALILKYIFALRLGWLPSIGRQNVLISARHPTNFYVLDGIITGNWAAAWDAVKHLILPGIALGSLSLAIIVRITRAAVLDVLHEDYVRTARAKGLRPVAVDGRHVLRNALLPVATIVGLQVGLVLSGAVVTETVFDIPGVGSWLKNAIFDRDYPVLQAGILFLGVVFVIVNLIVDISYAAIDPRIRLR